MNKKIKEGQGKKVGERPMFGDKHKICSLSLVFMQKKSNACFVNFVRI